jgi:hypothetical protein
LHRDYWPEDLVLNHLVALQEVGDHRWLKEVTLTANL